MILSDCSFKVTWESPLKISSSEVQTILFPVLYFLCLHDRFHGTRKEPLNVTLTVGVVRVNCQKGNSDFYNNIQNEVNKKSKHSITYFKYIYVLNKIFFLNETLMKNLNLDKPI